MTSSDGTPRNREAASQSRVWRSAVIAALAVVCFWGGFLAKAYVDLLRSPNQDLRSPTGGERATAGDPPPEAVAKQKEMRKALQKRFNTIGYLGGYKEAPQQTGVIQHDSSRAFQALNFFTAGHALEAYLMDMDGSVVHTWRRNSEEVAFEETADPDAQQNWWRRGYVYDNGDLLVIRENASLTKLDKDSNVIWRQEAGFHHDLDVLDDGRIFVLTTQKRRIPYLRREDPSDDDRITVLSEDGEVIRELSILDAFNNSSYSGVPLRSAAPVDILHTNTLEVLDGRLASKSEFFKRGNVLVSCLYVDAIAIIDLEQQAVVWALSGMWRAQHQPTILDNGNILLFDNRGHHERAKIIEFDPFTQQLVWSYMGPDGNGLWSRQLGSNQRLANGNTLITDSVNGRAFEVTSAGDIVWEYVNPGRTGAEKALIAVMCEMVRLDPDFPIDWIPESSNE